MRTITTTMKALLNTDGLTALATFWKLTRKDGTVLGFTDWTTDVVGGTVTYEASSGMTRSALQQRVDLAVPNEEINGILTSDQVKAADIRAGLYNGATLTTFMAVPTDPDFLNYGTIVLPGAFLGEVQIQDGTFLFEVRGLAYALNQTFVNCFIPVCRADFADKNAANKCKLDPANFTVTGTVGTVETQFFSFISSDVSGAGTTTPPAANGAVFLFGLLTWTSGENLGFSAEIVSEVGQSLPNFGAELYLPTPYPISVGDAFSALAGCDKTIGRCSDYNNNVNFRGVPFIPGLTKLFDVGVATA
jgi:uncharacterized phage protein (TIGR02218 family)